MTTEGHIDLYDVYVTTLAPLFIGSGKSLMKKEYALIPAGPGRPQLVCLFDENKLFKLLVENNLIDKYEQFMLGTDTDFYTFLYGTCGLKNTAIKAASRAIIDPGDALDEAHSLKEILTFVRNGVGKIYVPGSSLKGAIRTAILAEKIIAENKNHTSDDLQLSDRKFGTEFEGEYLNTLNLKKKNNIKVNDAINSVLRKIQISDSEPLPDDVMVLSGKSDADLQGNINRINICRECVRPGTKIHFKMGIDRSIPDESITGESIINSLRNFNACYERVFSSKFNSPINAVKVAPQTPLYLGGGVGFVSKTITYPYLGEETGFEEVVQILQRAFCRHKHEERDKIEGVSPRMMKYAQYNGDLYEYGLCEVSIE